MFVTASCSQDIHSSVARVSSTFSHPPLDQAWDANTCDSTNFYQGLTAHALRLSQVFVTRRKPLPVHVRRQSVLHAVGPSWLQPVGAGEAHGAKSLALRSLAFADGAAPLTYGKTCVNQDSYARQSL